jgi:uncharacterized membrane protein SirB2
MLGILYEVSLLDFVLVTLIIGGGTAWMTGRACAITWRPVPVLVFYTLILAAGVRFVHFSIFGGSLLTLQYYVVDAIILLGISLLAYKVTRAGQMVRQYYWLYDRAGLTGYRQKG